MKRLWWIAGPLLALGVIGLAVAFVVGVIVSPDAAGIGAVGFCLLELGVLLAVFAQWGEWS